MRACSVRRLVDVARAIRQRAGDASPAACKGGHVASEQCVAHEELGGDGQVALLIHGGGMNLEWWRPSAELLRERLRVVALDLQGHGQSAPRGLLGYDSWVEDVRRVLDRVEAESALLIGHSFGGRVAFATAAAHPYLCDGLVAVDGTLVDWEGPPRALLSAAFDEQAYLAAAERDPLKSFHGSADDLERLLGGISVSERRREILRRRFVPAGRDAVRHNPTPAEALSMLRIELDGKGVPHSTYDRIRCDVLSLYSEDSRGDLGPSWPYSQEEHDRLRTKYGFAVGWITGVHNTPCEEPDELVERILDWIGRRA